jgi:hypothetical protein
MRTIDWRSNERFEPRHSLRWTFTADNSWVDVSRWCDDTLRGKFSVGPGIAYLEDDNDAMLFKLMWCHGETV